MKFEEYQIPELPTEGYFCEVSQYWILRKKEEFEEREGLDFLEIGGPGTDGIGFGLRKGFKGIWAYYPIDNEFEMKADTAKELIEGYTNGSITV